LPTTRHRCNLYVWPLAQAAKSALATPGRVLSEYKDLILIFFRICLIFDCKDYWETIMQWNDIKWLCYKSQNQEYAAL